MVKLLSDLPTSSNVPTSSCTEELDLVISTLITERRQESATQPRHRYPRVDVFRYALESYANLTIITRAFLYVELDKNTVRANADEIHQLAVALFGSRLKVFRPWRIITQAGWRTEVGRWETFGETDRFGRLPSNVLFLQNDDHVFIDHDEDVLREGVRRLCTDSTRFKTLMLSHWGEAIGLARKFQQPLLRGSFIVSRLTLLDAVQVFSREYLNFALVELPWRTAIMTRIDNLIRQVAVYGNRSAHRTAHYSTESGLQSFYVPLRELCRKFDGYGQAGVSNVSVPRLVLPHTSNTFSTTPEGLERRMSSHGNSLWAEGVEMIRYIDAQGRDRLCRLRCPLPQEWLVTSLRLQLPQRLLPSMHLPQPQMQQQASSHSSILLALQACLTSWRRFVELRWENATQLQMGTHRIFDVHDWNKWPLKDGHACTMAAGAKPDVEMAGVIASSVVLNRRPFFALPPNFLPWVDESMVIRTAATISQMDQHGCSGYEAHGHFQRIGRSELYTNLSHHLRNDPFLEVVVKLYLNLSVSDTFGKQVATADVFGAGSSPGGGWHKDTNEAHNMKVLMYLDNVRGDNSPFSVLVGYDEAKLHSCRWHDWEEDAKPSRSASSSRAPARCALPFELRANTWDGLLQPQFPEADVERYLTLAHQAGDNVELQGSRGGRTRGIRKSDGGRGDVFALEVWAPQGTVIFFDTQNIHRGKLNLARQRRSVTVYYQKPRSHQSKRLRNVVLSEGNEFGSFCYRSPPYAAAPTKQLIQRRPTCEAYCLERDIDAKTVM